MTCDPNRMFKTDPFTGSVKCEIKIGCGPWRKRKFVHKPKKSQRKTYTDEISDLQFDY